MTISTQNQKPSYRKVRKTNKNREKKLAKIPKPKPISIQNRWSFSVHESETSSRKTTKNTEREKKQRELAKMSQTHSDFSSKSMQFLSFIKI